MLFFSSLDRESTFGEIESSRRALPTRCRSRERLHRMLRHSNTGIPTRRRRLAGCGARGTSKHCSGIAQV